MSKARLVITAVVVEGRSQGQVAGEYGVSQGWVSRLVARYRAEGEAAFEPRSRRPQSSPSAVSHATVELIVRLRKDLADRGLDAGPHTICWHLEHHHQVRVSAATVSRYLTRQGLVTPDPRKRPRSSYLRFAAELPNECWQSDFTHYRLAGGADTEIIGWLDDHSRLIVHLTAHRRVTGPIVVASFRAACAAYGVPASTLTDNGLVYTTRFAGGRGGRNAFEHELARLGIRQKKRQAEPPADPGQDRAALADPAPLARRPARPARDPRPAADPTGHLHRDLQPPAAAPLPAPPRHTCHRVCRPAQSQPRQQRRRPPRPRPRRHHRHQRHRHPAHRRAPLPPRRRPDPRPNPRPAPGPRPARPDHQRSHRRTATRPDSRPQPRLPANRPAARTRTPKPAQTQRLRTLMWVRSHSDVLRHHNGGGGGI